MSPLRAEGWTTAPGLEVASRFLGRLRSVSFSAVREELLDIGRCYRPFRDLPPILVQGRARIEADPRRRRIETDAVTRVMSFYNGLLVGHAQCHGSRGCTQVR